MLGTLLDWVKDVKWKLECKHCRYKSLFAICFIRHLLKCHNIKPTKKDIKILLKYSFLIRLLKCVVACVLIPPLFILKFVFIFIGDLGELL